MAQSFTPDNKYYFGEAPELKGFWIAADTPIGIVSSGGAGMVFTSGSPSSPPFDLWDVDIRRAQPSKGSSLLKDRVKESLGLLYASFPYRQVKTSGVRRSPLPNI